MDEILNKLSDISALSADEIEELGTQLTNEFQNLQGEDISPEVVENMQRLANAKKALGEEVSRRETEAKELASMAEAAAEVFNTESDEDSTDADAEDAEVTEEETTAALNDVEEEEEIPADEVPVDEEIAVDVEPVVEEIVEELPADEIVVDDEAVAPVDETEELPAEDETVEEVVEDEIEEEDKPLENFSNEESEESDEDKTELSTETESEEKEKPEEAEDSASELSLESDENVSENVNTEFSAPDNNAPVEAEAKTVRRVITAGADLKNIGLGAEIPNTLALAAAVVDRRNAMGRTSGGDGEQALVASISVDGAYEDSRTLLNNDTEGNMEKIKAVVASAKAGENTIIAAGGLMGPVDTTWDIPELGEQLGRPVKDSLPSFKATRGGLRFISPPVLEDLNGAVSVWTLQDDIDAADPASDKVKPCIRVAAGEEVTVYLEAMPLCLTFGNIGARAYPELVERHIALAMVWQARFAETRLLTRIGELSTQVTAAAELGAARDILVQIDQAASGLRNRHRLDQNAPLRAIFPEWFRKALRSDLVKQLPGDGQDVAFGLQDSTVDRWFSDRNVSVTWTPDGESGQIMGAQANGALNPFPSDVIWYLFPEGTFLFLEDATLDLGLVRDSTLNATNDYKMFLETFENVAKVGVESLRITSAVKIAGASAGTVNTLA